VKLARQVNENMPNYVVELLTDALKESGKVVKDSVVAVLGVSYKPQVRDVQLSPLEAVVNLLEQKGAKVRIYDPMFIDSEVFEHKTEKSLDRAISGSDALVIGTAHNEFLKMDLERISTLMHKPGVLVDTRNAISSESAKKAHLIYRGVGRGQFDNLQEN
jgi:UDP-N-acetyl-D-mannosaminuronate dehydrogenase